MQIIKTAAEIKLNPLTTESFKRITAKSTASAPRAYTGVPELIVTLTLLDVTQNFVGFVDFFELLFVSTFFVRVILNGGPTKSLLDLIFRCVLGNT